MQEGHVLTWI